ncbi:MAG: serine/threonine-protein kinase [Polyangiaceae bacterium]
MSPDRPFRPSSYPPAGEQWASEGLPRAFGDYVLLRRRATGGMAELFVATRRGPAPGDLVVIKKVLSSIADSDRDALSRLLVQEGRTMAALSHANVARLLDSGSVGGAPYIVLERVHGEDLRSIVRQMRRKRVAEFPIESALGIVLGVCEGLAHVHERCAPSGEPLGIVHRDVSPQNVLVTFRGEVKLVDFGVAESRAQADDAREGRPKGKLPYMSPEQARGQALDGRSDVFSTGVLLFELTTGQRLFKGAGDRETRALLLDRPYPRPSHVFALYPPALEIIVERALAKDRDQRWSSAREMGTALRAFVRDEGVDVGPPVLGRMMTSLFEEEMQEEASAITEAQRVAGALLGR